MEENNEFWGYHLILDCAGADHDAIRSYDTIYNFVKELVPTIDMVAYGEPQIVNFGTEDKAGYTLVQLIETSNICAHFANESESIYLDVFSCKPFDPQKVIEVVLKYFNPTSHKIALINRQA